MRKSNSVCAPSRLMAHSHPSCSLLGSAVPSGRLGTCICHLVLPAPNVEHCSLWERASTSDVIPFPENQQVPLSCDLLELVSSHQQSQLATQSALRGHSNPLTPLRMREAIRALWGLQPVQPPPALHPSKPFPWHAWPALLEPVIPLA